jgi:hypothetical protein
LKNTLLITSQSASLGIEKVHFILQLTTQTEIEVLVIIAYVTEKIGYVADIDYNKITKTLHITCPKITLYRLSNPAHHPRKKTDPNNHNLASTLYYYHEGILIHGTESAQAERNRINIMNPLHNTTIMNIEEVLELRGLDSTQYTIIILIDEDSDTTKVFIKASTHEQVKLLE